MAADDRRHPPMTILTVPPRSRIRIGTTSILVRIRHVLTGMIIGRRLRIGRVNTGMVREDGTTTRAAGQAMARVGDKANGNPATAPAGDQVNLASRDRVVPVEGLGNLDKVAVRASRDSLVSRDRADARVSPVSRSSLGRAVVRASRDSLVNRDRADVRVNPVSRSNLVKAVVRVSRDRADARVSLVSRSSLGRADVRVSRDSLVNRDRADVRVNPVSRSNLVKAVVRVSRASLVSRDRADARVSLVSRSSLVRVAVRVSPVSLVRALARVSRHSSPLDRRAPLPRLKSRSRGSRRSRDSPDNRDGRLIRKGLALPNRLGANLLS